MRFALCPMLSVPCHFTPTPETFFSFITGHLDSTRLEKNKIQPAICKPAMKNANMKRILVRGMMLVGVFQCLTLK
jgi:hypothetical protein